MSEDPAERTRSYLNAMETALETIGQLIDPKALRIVDSARRYVADSRYFLESGKPTTALASVAYAEGLLDSLKILGLEQQSYTLPVERRINISMSQLMRGSGTQDESGVRESENEKTLKAIYLLQLQRPWFSKAELAQKVGFDQSECEALLRNFLASGMLERRDEDKYALLPHGRSKLKIVLVGGVYDVLHVGHLAALAEAKTYGDVLIVVVATDLTVETLKGRRPVFPEEDRRALVDALKPVDAAILGYEDVGMGYQQVIDDVKPNIIGLGYDQDSLARTITEFVSRRKLEIELVRLSKFDSEKYLSSSEIRQAFLEESKR